MESVTLKVTFAEHLPADRISSLVSGIAAYGNVIEANESKTYSVEVFRVSHLPQLKEQLTRWERYGSLWWSIAT